MGHESCKASVTGATFSSTCIVYDYLVTWCYKQHNKPGKLASEEGGGGSDRVRVIDIVASVEHRTLSVY